MVDAIKRGFPRKALRERCEIKNVEEDLWHAYSGMRTDDIIKKQFKIAEGKYSRLLNAGSSVYSIDLHGWTEFPIDLFGLPMRGLARATCANIEDLPFSGKSFDAVVCVGEVISYCDPSRALREFSRVLTPDGKLILDFANSKSMKHLFTDVFNKSADMIDDFYNGRPEKVWVYSPSYIFGLINEFGMEITNVFGTHRFSPIFRRFGLSCRVSIKAESRLHALPFADTYSDLITVVASRLKV